MNCSRAWLTLLVFFIFVAAVAGAATRPLTLSELEAIQVTTPVLKVVVGEPRFVLNVQVNYEGEGWKTVYNGGAGDPDGYLILLEGYPDKVRAGLTGYFNGPLAIDGISLIKPDGSELVGTRATPVNSASNAENVLAFDGKCASISHSADPPEQRDRLDGVEVIFEYEGGKPAAEPIPRPQVELPPARYGLYLANHGIGDPHAVPPGVGIPFDVEACARYDFSIMGGPNAEQFARIMELNPNHRVILRGWAAHGDFLGYFYDEEIRAAKRKAVLDEIASCGPVLYGYTYGEEELQHTCFNWHSSDKPQAWCTAYSTQYEQETGNAFKWQSGELQRWLAEKIKFFYNDLYSVIKEKCPELKVYPWTYVPGDRSGWGWIDPAELDLDGWIYQWFAWGDNYMLHDCVHPHADIKQVWVAENCIEWGLEQLRRAGVPKDEIYVQIWGFTPSDNSMAQAAHLRSAGIENIFNFYYWATIVPEPPPNTNTSDLSFAVFAANESEVPIVRQPDKDAAMTVGLGLAQSFAAPWDRLGSIEIELLSAPEARHEVTIQASHNGRPSGKALLTASLGSEAAPGPFRVDSRDAVLEIGKTYWITIRPEEAGEGSGLSVAGSGNNPYAAGEMLRWETLAGGYFNGWRVTDPRSLIGVGTWPESYQERLRFETLLTGKRDTQ